ncbi:MOSC domain-containing protein [Demetria terragena]|uniref:MOSC domain-containing protein n=1 Tax=Demetria terragena TaxID=63959 RepID=UPI000378568D|nr:MOSC domain-containing protein [Demetria terragena]
MPTVASIHIAPGRRLPTKSVDQVEAQGGAGLVGDRYHGSRHRHVTIQSAPDLADASHDWGQPIDPGQTRRNITITDGPLPTRPGDPIRIGDVHLEVVRIAAPCRIMDDCVGEGAMRALHNRGGVVARLLTSGTIRVGDAVDLAPEPLAEHLRISPPIAASRPGPRLP